MKSRDRLFLMIVAAGAVLVLAYMMVVAPVRNQASALGAQVASAQASLATAQSQMSNARAAKRQYGTAYASLLELGKAVPTTDDTASLIYQLDKATHQKSVAFNSITTGAAGAAGAPAAAPAPAPPGAAIATFTPMPFTFQFQGSFFQLYSVLDRLNHLTTQTGNGGLDITGRLLTVTSTSLSGTPSRLTGTISATAYTLPSPPPAASAPAAPGATPAAGAPSPVPTTPALVKATP